MAQQRQCTSKSAKKTTENCNNYGIGFRVRVSV